MPVFSISNVLSFDNSVRTKGRVPSSKALSERNKCWRFDRFSSSVGIVPLS